MPPSAARSPESPCTTLAARGRGRGSARLVACCWFLLFPLLACSEPAVPRHNVLLVIADDLGVDRVAAYGEHPDPGRTPVLDGLAARGVLFRNAWANTSCSPTRATILTGRYSFRTGIGTPILERFEWPGLSLDEHTVAEVLRSTHRCEATGKWHLASSAEGGAHPLGCGFRHHRGSLFNLHDYSSWEKSVDGSLEACTTYATTDTVDDTLQLVRSLPEPWFIWMAFNAPHARLHTPPEELHSFEIDGDYAPVEQMKAMVEALDTELGRLLAEVDEDTTVIFVGDNGTYRDATDPPFLRKHAKGTLYEGGVNVPLIVCGPEVAQPGSESAALVNTTDLFQTIVELARGAPAEVPATLDSVSLVPYLRDPGLPSLRDTVYAEKFRPNLPPGPYVKHHRTIRGPRYKLIERPAPEADELYDLERDPFEENDLLRAPLSAEQAAVYDELKGALAALLAS